MASGDHERIRRKAYEIWEKEGKPHGRHEDHWRAAHESSDGAQDSSDRSEDAAGLTAGQPRDATAQDDAAESVAADPESGKPSKDKAAPVKAPKKAAAAKAAKKK